MSIEGAAVASYGLSSYPGNNAGRHRASALGPNGSFSKLQIDKRKSMISMLLQCGIRGIYTRIFAIIYYTECWPTRSSAARD